MRRRLRALIVSLIAAITAVAAPQALAQQPGAAATAYDTVASCLRERGHLLVLALIDESGSLKANDPDDKRVVALDEALRSFARFGRGPDSSDAPEIELLVAAFSSDFAALGGWEPLNRETLPGIETRVSGLAERDSGPDTDFATALDGAKGAFTRKDADATAAGSPPACRLLLLFTDGQYDILARRGPSKPYARDVPLTDSSRVVDAGRRFLCDPGNVADQLRSTDTVVVAVALQPVGSPAPDQSFLRGVAEAQSPGDPACGERRSPPGALIEAQDAGRLFEAFDGAVTQALGGTPVAAPLETPVCAPDDNGSRCVRTFELDRTLSEFHILVNLAQPGVAVDLSPPRGAPLRLRVGDERGAALGGATLDVVAASRVDLVIDGSLPPADTGWVGTWTARFVDETGTNAGAVTRSQITVFGGLTATVAPRPEFRAGETTAFDVRVVDAAGSPSTPVDFVGSSTVRAAVVAPDGRRQQLRLGSPAVDGSYRTSYEVPADSTDPSIDLELTLEVTTRGGLQLRPRVQTYTIPVLAPAGYPTVAPTELFLSPIIEEGAAGGSITVTGTPGPGGCVWFAGLDPGVAPNNTGALTPAFAPAATTQASCVRVAPGESVAVAVRVSPDTVRSGLVQGGLRVRSTGADPAQVRATTLPVRFEMQRSSDPIVVFGFLITLLLIGALLPLALLWLLNWFITVFPSPGLLRRAVKEVRVTGTDVEPVGTGWSVPLARDFTALVAPASDAPTGSCRRFGDHDLTFRTRVPVLPVLLPYGSVSVADRDTFASDGADGGGKRRHRGRVAPGLHPTWVFVLDRVESLPAAEGAAEPVVVGRLFLYVTDGNVESKAQQILGKARDQLPRIIVAAAAALPPPETVVVAAAGSGPDTGPAGGPDVFVPPTGRH